MVAYVQGIESAVEGEHGDVVLAVACLYHHGVGRERDKIVFVVAGECEVAFFLIFVVAVDHRLEDAGGRVEPVELVFDHAYAFAFGGDGREESYVAWLYVAYFVLAGHAECHILPVGPVVAVMWVLVLLHVVESEEGGVAVAEWVGDFGRLLVVGFFTLLVVVDIFAVDEADEVAVGEIGIAVGYGQVGESDVASCVVDDTGDAVVGCEYGGHAVAEGHDGVFGGEELFALHGPERGYAAGLGLEHGAVDFHEQGVAGGFYHPSWQLGRSRSGHGHGCECKTEFVHHLLSRIISRLRFILSASSRLSHIRAHLRACSESCSARSGSRANTLLVLK